MAQLAYTTREINRNFLIKVAGVNGTGTKLNTLVGVSGLVKLIGVELTNSFLRRSFANRTDSCVCKLRRGLKVTFYVK